MTHPVQSWPAWDTTCESEIGPEKLHVIWDETTCMQMHGVQDHLIINHARLHETDRKEIRG